MKFRRSAGVALGLAVAAAALLAGAAGAETVTSPVAGDSLAVTSVS
jgi:hypothetical protein